MVAARGLICSKESCTVFVAADMEVELPTVVVVVVGVEGQARDTGVEAKGRLPTAEAVVKSPCGGLLGSATHGELHSGMLGVGDRSIGSIRYNVGSRGLSVHPIAGYVTSSRLLRVGARGDPPPLGRSSPLWLNGLRRLILVLLGVVHRLRVHDGWIGRRRCGRCRGLGECWVLCWRQNRHCAPVCGVCCSISKEDWSTSSYYTVAALY